jgi:membrane protease YdiL (CAAX protease family)
MNNEVVNRTEAIVSAVMRGDYDRVIDLDRMQESEKYPREEIRLLRSLGLMSVKLEAREIELARVIGDLKSKNELLLEGKRKNRLFSTIFVSLFLSISLYVFLIFFAGNHEYHQEDAARIVEIIFLTACIVIIKRSGFPFSSMGVSLEGASASIRRILPGTLAACAALVLIKGLFMLTGVGGMDGRLIVMDNFDLLFAVYLPVAVLQEFMARGVIQTAIEHVLDEKNAALWAILTSSALFGLVHIELSVGVAAASFFCSLYWGYIYTKTRCLVGVSLSHFIIGDLAYVLGLWDYLFTI